MDLPSLQKEDIKTIYQEEIKLNLNELNNVIINNQNNIKDDINFYDYNFRKMLHKVSQKILPKKEFYKNGKILFTHQ